MISTLGYFVVTLFILILVHEFGHFIAAKKNGAYVEEFGFGFPPRVIGKKIGEIIYHQLKYESEMIKIKKTKKELI